MNAYLVFQRADGGIAMARYVEIAKAGDLPDGQMRRVAIDGHELLVAQVEGTCYALDARCPHLGEDLSRGTLVGTIVTCPRHHSQFDIRDGHVVRWTDWTGFKLSAAKLLKSPQPVRSYEVRVDGDAIAVRLD